MAGFLKGSSDARIPSHHRIITKIIIINLKVYIYDSIGYLSFVLCNIKIHLTIDLIRKVVVCLKKNVTEYALFWAFLYCSIDLQ